MGWPMQPVGAAPAVTSHVIPGGPGRPSGSYYGEPAIAGRHGRNERQVKACASPVYRKRSGDRKRRKQSSLRRLRKLVCAERRRACARVLSATTPGRTPPAPMGSPPVGSRCGLRSNGSVQRRSAPPAFFRGRLPLAPCARERSAAGRYRHYVIRRCRSLAKLSARAACDLVP